jgi:hypothetical protein
MANFLNEKQERYYFNFTIINAKETSFFLGRNLLSTYTDNLYCKAGIDGFEFDQRLDVFKFRMVFITDQLQ